MFRYIITAIALANLFNLSMMASNSAATKTYSNLEPNSTFKNQKINYEDSGASNKVKTSDSMVDMNADITDSENTDTKKEKDSDPSSFDRITLPENNPMVSKDNTMGSKNPNNQK